MTYTEVTFGDEARNKVLAGAKALADTLRGTLGPKSRAVLLGRKWGTPLVCDDGVTIAREVKLRDPLENMGAQMLRQAAVRTGDAVGDGTTTATLLAYAIFSEGVRNVVAGASAVELKRGFDAGARAAADALRALAQPVKTRAEKAQVATVSAHGDRSIGALVAEALERVGADGVVSIEEAKGMETTLDVVEGMRFPQGYLSPYFVTDAAKMEAVIENPLVLLYERRVANMASLVPLLEAITREGGSLLVVAEDVEGDALATLVINKLHGALPCVAVKAPGFGDRRKAMLRDIAIVTGAEVVSEETGTKLEAVRMGQLGRARRVVVDREATTIIGGGGDKTAIGARCDELRRAIDASKSDYDKEQLRERLAKLAGGVAVIRAGAPTEAEMKNRKDAFEDAISATQAAMAEGIVAGGGVALLRASAAVEKLAAAELQGDRATALRVLARAMEVPLRQIASNAQIDPGVVIERVRAGDGPFGFDASTATYGDLALLGIVDPVKVVRVALENAVSVAGVLLLSDAALTEVEEPSREPHAPPVLQA
jgi:chaperonin GroEL